MTHFISPRVLATNETATILAFRIRAIFLSGSLYFEVLYGALVEVIFSESLATVLLFVITNYGRFAPTSLSV